jgi:DNA-directed RNA polymerase subunit beta
VLLKEMQSLALDVNVVSEEGQRTEMRDEDDDLLRAAEELGIDLSGVRAPANGAADEALEDEDAADAADAPSGESADGADPKDAAKSEDAGAQVLAADELDVEELLGESVAELDIEALAEGAPEQELVEKAET